MADVHQFIKFDEYRGNGLKPKGIWVLVIITDLSMDYNLKVHVMKDSDMLAPDLSLTWSEFTDSYVEAKMTARQIISQCVMPSIVKYGINDPAKLKVQLWERKLGD